MMIRFYDAAIETEMRGSAQMFREPPLKGQVLFSIADAVHGDVRRLYVCDCADEEHAENASLPQVKELDEAEATRLAAEYQPERVIPRSDPVTGEAETLTIPACDLVSLLAGGQFGSIGGELLREE